jgi:glycerol kinase
VPVRMERLSATVAWSQERAQRPTVIDAVYALEGNITSTGAAIQWVATMVGLEGREAELEALARSVPDAGGVYLVPAFTGLGAPHWDAGARGLVCGLSRGTTPAHLARAAFDAIAYQVRDVLEVLGPAVGATLHALYADGGAIQSELPARTVADIVGMPVLVSRSESLAALGAAYLAGIAVGTWGSLDEIRSLERTFDRVDPRPASPASTDGYAGWRVALQRAASTVAA